MCFISYSKRYNCGKAEPRKKNRRIKGVGGEGEDRKQRGYKVRSIRPKFRPIRPGKVVHLKKWTSFFETFPVGLNRSILFYFSWENGKCQSWTEISRNFGSVDRAHNYLTAFFPPPPQSFSVSTSVQHKYMEGSSESIKKHLFQFGTAQQFFTPSPARNFDCGTTLERF